MRKCHSCQAKLDQAALARNNCPECGSTIVRPAARTVEMRLPEPDDSLEDIDLDSISLEQPPEEVVLDETIESEIFDLDAFQDDDATPLEETIDVAQFDPNQIQPTVDFTSSELEEPPAPLETAADTVVPEQANGTVKKTPTVGDRSDMTMEFEAPPDHPSAVHSPAGETQQSDEPPKAKGWSTHTLESDRTIDLDMSSDEGRNLSSQWKGTFEREARQGQTIRQRDTVTGFRSSLPVKSRFIREKRQPGVKLPPPKSAADVPDYELLDIIGEGGMGVVYAAHQSSIARTVAVKMLKPSAKVRDDQRDKFISEAVVTGELDHPNIVPIYDLGSNDQGALFYSMKRVRGTPWDKVIHQKQLDENLSILLRVADAVAFAHAGGVIHRDLKPENVMLGDYGEVLVMDWGLARVTPDFAHANTVYQADSLGGTPAYMSPEMAKGPVERINKTSDIYLLGAILYEIIGGNPPHSGRDVMQCLMAASQNRIDPNRYDGELKTIALKAMATHQEDRYQTVKEFQEAIRTYQSHSESLVLTAHANQNLQKARGLAESKQADAVKDAYKLYARALYGFQESLTLWDGNNRARTLLTETQRDYAKCALGNGDLDLAASLLDGSNADHHELLKRIDAARRDRDARARRLRLAKMAVAALLATVVATISIAFFSVRAQRNKAVVARQEAEEQRGIAESQKKVAEEQRGVAVTQRNRAEEQTKIATRERDRANEQTEIATKERDNAQKQEKIAVEQRGLAEKARNVAEEARAAEEVSRKAAEEAKIAEEYEAYVAQIGLAASKINDNAYDFAKDLLNTSEPGLRNWEWGRLMHLCQLGAGSFDAKGPVQAVAYSPDGKTFATGDMAGNVTLCDAETGRPIHSAKHGQYVLSVAYSPNGRYLATGSSDGKIRIEDISEDALRRQENKPITLEGHKDGVLSVRFSPDGRQLLSGSYDSTARLWDLATRQTIQELKGHSWWVWAAEFSDDGKRIVTAGQDGKAVVWEKGARSEERGAESSPQPPAPNPIFSAITEFTGHDGAIYSAKFSPDGKLVATGSADKMVMVWNPDEVEPIDIAKRLAREPEEKVKFTRLAGHSGPVRSVGFSPNGELVLSGSEDNTVRVWDVAAGAALKSLRGHGNPVRACVFSPNGKWVLSGSDDNTVRIWNMQGYQEVRVLHSTVFAGHEDAVLAARFTRDGNKIITASRDRTASLWNSATGEPLKRFEEGHEFLVSGAAFFPDGKRLATGAGDNSVRIWNATAGTQQAMFYPTGRVGAVAVSPDGKWVATGSKGTEVQIWSADDVAAEGEELKPAHVLKGQTTEVSALAFSPTGDMLATGGLGRRIQLWRREQVVRGSPDPARPDVARSGDRPQQTEWTFVREIEGHSGSITGLRFTPDGQRLISASGDKSCGQWNVATGEELRDLVLKHPEWVNSLDVSADGSLALTTCDDGYARLWRLADARQVAAVKAPGKPFNAGGFSPDGSTAVLTSAEDKRVWRWELSPALAAANPASAPALGEPMLDFSKRGSEVWSALFAPDGRRFLTLGGNDAQLWDLDAKKPVVSFSPHGAVASAAISPDGRYIATGSWDHSAKIWDEKTGRALVKLLGGHAGYINSVEFSPSGTELLTASDDGTARIWKLDLAELAKAGPTTTVKPPASSTVFTGHKARVLSATYSPDGKRVLTVSADKTGRVWDAQTGELKFELPGHEWAVLSGQFSPDGKRIITGSQDESAKIWDAENGKELLTLRGHTAAILTVAISPDGERALTGSQDNIAKLWDAKTGKEILSLPGHTQEVTSVSFSPNGRDVLTGSRDGRAIIWLANDWHDEKANVAKSN